MKPPISIKRIPIIGFTLVEVLVSLTVLSMIVYLVANITGSAAKSVGSGTQRIATSAEVRSVFNRMAIDFANMVRREDVHTVFKNDNFRQGTGSIGVNDQFAFYSNVRGTTAHSPMSEISSTSLVAYTMSSVSPFYTGQSVLERLSMALGWERNGGLLSMAYLPVVITTPPGTPSTGASELIAGLLPDPAVTSSVSSVQSDFQVIGDQVFRMEYTYLLKTKAGDPVSFNPLSIEPKRAGGSIVGLQDVAAIVVGIAVLDSDARNRLTNYDKLIQALPNAEDGKDIMAKWLPVLEGGSLATAANIPQSAANSVRIYQRYFYLHNK